MGMRLKDLRRDQSKVSGTIVWRHKKSGDHTSDRGPASVPILDTTISGRASNRSKFVRFFGCDCLKPLFRRYAFKGKKSDRHSSTGGATLPGGPFAADQPWPANTTAKCWGFIGISDGEHNFFAVRELLGRRPGNGPLPGDYVDGSLDGEILSAAAADAASRCLNCRRDKARGDPQKPPNERLKNLKGVRGAGRGKFSFAR